MREARRRPAAFGRLRRWLPVAAWMLVIFAFSSIPNLDPGGSGRLNFGVSKLGHIAVFGVLGLLVANALARPRMRRWLWWTFVICVLYAISDEIHQSLVPGRDPSILDVAIDGVSALVGGVLRPLITFRWLEWRRRRREGARGRSGPNPAGLSPRGAESHIDDRRAAP